jgi:glyoxylase-like metal-dependent hydrolase (beta-lactamase superfamily II)
VGFVPVADDVLVRTSRRERTTTTLALGRPAGRRAGTGRAALLVDPAWAPDELDAIALEARALGARVRAGFATHAHHDHLLWPAALEGVPRWASPGAAAVARRARARLLAELAADERRYAEAYPPQVRDGVARVEPTPGGAVPDPDGVLPPIELVVHDGHAPGHAALWLPAARVLVAGDMLSDAELPLPFDEITGGEDAPGRVEAYLAGLDRLAPAVARADVLVPGHGTPTREPARRLNADRRYLEDIVAGRRVDDPRLALPGMAAAHARFVRALAARR